MANQDIRVRENSLDVKSASESDFVRVVGANGKSYRVEMTDLKGLIASVIIDGSTESLQEAIDTIVEMVDAIHIYYGTCDTDTATMSKIVVCPEFQLKTGAIIAVKFTSQGYGMGGTIQSLNVNSTGAKYIQYRGSFLTLEKANLNLNKVYEFVYDGTYYNLVGDLDTVRTVDSALSDTSENPVQNKVVKAEVDDLKEDLNELEDSVAVVRDTVEQTADLYICDANGNVIGEYIDGHIVTKNFDSREVPTGMLMEADRTNADLYICDGGGNVIAEFANGHIITKNFNSENLAVELSNMSQEISTHATEIYNMKRVKTRMEFGAHNGAEYYAPECTIPAYRIAGQQGWGWAWIAGIYFSAENSMYVLHDGTVDRTTDGAGSISQMTDAQIDALNITQTGEGYNLSDFDPAELKIPTFEQVVQQCVRYGMKMVIRLSIFPNEANEGENKAKWDAFMEIINGYGIQPEDISCYLDTGTKAQTCRELIGEDVEISTHLGSSATAQDFVDWFDSRSITGRKAAILSYQNTNLEAVKLLHTHGIRCYTFGANSATYASNCASLGVDIYQNGKIYKLTE